MHVHVLHVNKVYTRNAMHMISVTSQSTDVLGAMTMHYQHSTITAGQGCALKLQKKLQISGSQVRAHPAFA